jgi:hypothetical protein
MMNLKLLRGERDEKGRGGEGGRRERGEEKTIADDKLGSSGSVLGNDQIGINRAE